MLEPGAEVVRAAFQDQKQLSESERHSTPLFGECVQNNRVEQCLFCGDEVMGENQSAPAQDAWQRIRSISSKAHMPGILFDHGDFLIWSP